MAQEKEGRKEPPRLASRFLHWYCPPSLYEGVEGDLLEAFEKDVRDRGLAAARRRFVFNTLRFFRPGILLRNKFTLALSNSAMIGNYFNTASRNIGKRKLYAFINASGLSIGIAFCLLIYLFIVDERSFDQFHTHKDRIYRLEGKTYDTWMSDGKNPYNVSPWIQTRFGVLAKEEIADIELMSRYSPDQTGVVRYGEKVFSERGITYVDADFFRMFSFPLLRGNHSRIFANKHEVVITPAIAAKYFGEDDPIDKEIEIDIDGTATYTVTGVIASPPGNSSLSYDILLPQPARPYYERNMQSWGSFNTPTFVQLHENAGPPSFKEALDRLTDKYLAVHMENWKAEAATPVPDSVKMIEYVFTPLTDIHLKASISWEKVSDPKYTFILGGVALLIVVIASINYISLALTTSASRGTEVGIRKAAGATRGQLVSQFCFESVLLAFISMTIGILLARLSLPLFNEFTGKQISITVGDYVYLAPVAAGVALVIGLVAGSYPAFFVSALRPALVLKGRLTSKLHAGFTKPLVVLQFALAAFLIVSSLIMFRQMRYVTTKDLGFDKDQVMVVPTYAGWTEVANRTVERFRQRADQEPLILNVSGTSSSFSRGYSRYGYKIGGEHKAAFIYAVDPYYLSTLGIDLVMGRNFDPAIATDTNAVIVNEALVRDMKWTDPLNEHLNWREDSLTAGARVIGVVKDYHFLSLERSVDPMFLSLSTREVGYLTAMLVKVAAGDLPAAVTKVEQIWKQQNPDRPFDYSFLDADVDRQYESYRRWMSLMSLATGLAILIACLGLFGLSGINAVNRTREIGIRKVLGADISSIFMMLNRQFVMLALVAFLLAAPVSWYVMQRWWLDNFEFKVRIGADLFFVAIGVALLVAFLSVSYHAIRAALTNPAKTLKYDG